LSTTGEKPFLGDEHIHGYIVVFRRDDGNNLFRKSQAYAKTFLIRRGQETVIIPFPVPQTVALRIEPYSRNKKKVHVPGRDRFTRIRLQNTKWARSKGNVRMPGQEQKGPLPAERGDENTKSRLEKDWKEGMCVDLGSKGMKKGESAA
jgi:hypothetical protein